MTKFFDLGFEAAVLRAVEEVLQAPAGPAEQHSDPRLGPGRHVAPVRGVLEEAFRRAEMATDFSRSLTSFLRLMTKSQHFKAIGETFTNCAGVFS